MAYSNINKPNEYFNTLTYTGDGVSPKSITGVGFQPDFVWLKNRGTTNYHLLQDVVRGATSTNVLSSNDSTAEPSFTNIGYISSFNSDGFTATSSGGSLAALNASGNTYVGWNWLAGGTASSNTDGDITSSVSASTTSGFSIATYTGNGTGSATFGHGLGATPKIVIIKRRDTSDGWQFWFNNTIRLGLNVSNADYGNNPISTSSTLVTTPSGVDTAWNTSGGSYVSYCFAEKKGFSKFGSYNGSAGVGAFVNNFQYLGFKPAFVMIKSYNAAESWVMFDNKRNGFNPDNDILLANESNAENNANNTGIDLLSNGFNPYYGTGTINRDGKSYIYMAFAENPFVGSDGTPVTAR